MWSFSTLEFPADSDRDFGGDWIERIGVSRARGQDLCGKRVRNDIKEWHPGNSSG